MATLTVYPSLDGYAAEQGVDVSWATIIVASGNGGADDETLINAVYIRCADTQDQFENLNRGIFLFDTSGIPDTAEIISAIFTLYGYFKSDQLSCTPDINIYSANPASNTALVGGDFDSLGSIPYCDTPITYANWLYSTTTPTGINNFIFNDVGIAAISKTDITKIGVRNANYDVSGDVPNYTNPNDVARLATYASEKGGAYRPKLIITYSLAYGRILPVKLPNRTINTEIRTE